MDYFNLKNLILLISDGNVPKVHIPHVHIYLFDWSFILYSKNISLIRQRPEYDGGESVRALGIYRVYISRLIALSRSCYDFILRHTFFKLGIDVKDIIHQTPSLRFFF